MPTTNKNNSSFSKNPREIAYLALLANDRDDSFISDILDQWMIDANPKQKDAALAKEIAYGSCRMALTLDAIAIQCSNTGRLSLKRKEKLLLHTALYQYFFLERIPIYAIANETMQIAKKYCHPQFQKFLNALIRKFENVKIQLPEGNSASALSIRYSYPPFYIDCLIKDYGITTALQLIEMGNHPSITMLRLRKKEALNFLPQDSYRIVENTNQGMAVLFNSSVISEIASNPNVYIQNATPVTLMHHLKEEMAKPASVLDLCASPGGKLILVQDYFPDAQLFANDISEQKIQKLQSNLDKYSLKATLSCGRGETLKQELRYDLIIVDAPCSNSGVLNKRPEARWRLSEDQLANLEATQLALLENAASLLSIHGEIWYLTCSILKAENEHLIDKACQTLGLVIKRQKTILPTADGWDGGFACSLRIRC